MQKLRTEIKRQLSQKIKGTFSVHTVDDMIIIDIYDRDYNVWRYIIGDISATLTTTLRTRIIVDVIINEYKSYIMSKYFR